MFDRDATQHLFGQSLKAHSRKFDAKGSKITRLSDALVVDSYVTCERHATSLQLAEAAGRRKSVHKREQGTAPYLRGGAEPGDLSVVDELIATEFLNHVAPLRRDRAPESLRWLATMLHTAFPDLRFTVEQLVAGVV